jgi:hypothetical protein
MDEQKKQIADRVQKANNILVTVSNNPSVDQLAACIGLTIALNKLDKHATAVFSGNVPSTIEFLNPGETSSFLLIRAKPISCATRSKTALSESLLLRIKPVFLIRISILAKVTLMLMLCLRLVLRNKKISTRQSLRMAASCTTPR